MRQHTIYNHTTSTRRGTVLLVDLRGGLKWNRPPRSFDPARLRHRPADLAPDARGRLRIHRAAILGLLTDGFTPAGNEAGYVLGERLGIADGLGLPTHPGSAACLVALPPP
ncbi:MAG TPA: hypothetical protein PKU91_06005, partial [Phycisphaerales bacterium]|nr:hypothetical protein [Phycisphaerales bacterium]